MVQNEKILRSFVKGNEDFAGEKFKLSEIFTAMDGLKKKVIEYLQQFIWHRLDKAKPLLEKALGIKFPDITSFMSEINIRHDIVHRGGRDKEGFPVKVFVEDVVRVAALVRAFADAMEEELQKAFPENPQSQARNSKF